MKFVVFQIRVKNFEKWKSVMDADAQAQNCAGLRLIRLWRSIDMPNRACFVMEVQNVEKARAFLTQICITWASKRAGVHQYEWHISEQVALPEADPA